MANSQMERFFSLIWRREELADSLIRDVTEAKLTPEDVVSLLFDTEPAGPELTAFLLLVSNGQKNAIELMDLIRKREITPAEAEDDFISRQKE